MRSIANGQLEGFPPKEQLRTVYVEHDIDASESNVPVAEYVYSDPILQDASHPAHSMVEEVLGSVGFTDVMQKAPVSSLSGGWKMKLALGEHTLDHNLLALLLHCFVKSKPIVSCTLVSSFVTALSLAHLIQVSVQLYHSSLTAPL